MLQENYVTFEQAKLLKEKEFPWDACVTMYNYNGEDTSIFSSVNKGEYSKPTLSLVQKWLREEKNINIDIQSNFDTVHKYWYYGCSIWNTNGKLYDQLNSFNLPEEALSAGINKALELI